MKATQKLGMIELTGVNIGKLTNKYSLFVYDYFTKGKKRIKFTKRTKNSILIPIPAYVGYPEYVRIEQQKRIDYPKKEIALRDHQKYGLSELLKNNHGILQAPAGSGKTHIGCELIRICGVKSVVIVPTIDIGKQWVKRFASTIKLQAGFIGGGNNKVGRQVTIMTYQSALKNLDLLAQFGLIFVDESHRTPCKSIRDILAACPAYYRYGCTATPWRSDGLHKAMKWLLGGVTAVIDQDMVGEFIKTVDVELILTGKYYKDDENIYMQGSIAADIDRNNMIVDKIEENRHHSIICLCNRKSQIKTLSKLVSGSYRIIDGNTNKQERENIIQEMREGDNKLLFATYQLASEGLDIPRLSCLVMASPVGNKTTIEQSCGRIARVFKDKEKPVVFDFVDSGMIPESLLIKRLATYKKLGYKVKDGEK